jgi:hypothetical protein
VVFQVSGKTPYNGYFLFHIWDLYSSPQTLEASIFNTELNGLLPILVGYAKEFPINDIRTLEKEQYLELLDYSEIPIPEEEFSKFRSKFKKQMKKAAPSRQQPAIPNTRKTYII